MLSIISYIFCGFAFSNMYFFFYKIYIHIWYIFLYSLLCLNDIYIKWSVSCRSLLNYYLC